MCHRAEFDCQRPRAPQHRLPPWQWPNPNVRHPFFSIAGCYHGKERLHHHNNDFGLFERIIKNLFSCLLVSCMRDHFFLHGKLRDLLPEPNFARRNQRVLACVPSKEMIRPRMRCVVFTRFPDLMQQIRRRSFRRAMQIVAEASFFFSRRRYQRAKLGLQHQLLPVARPQNHGQRHRILRELPIASPFTSAPRPLLAAGPLVFFLGHNGGDCTLMAPIGKRNCSLADHRATFRRPCALRSDCRNSSPYSAPANKSPVSRRATRD
jgi:hypothetical protein